MSVDELEKEAEELLQKAKRIRLTQREQIFGILDKDLAAWKEKLQRTSQEDGCYKLMLYLPEYQGYEQMYRGNPKISVNDAIWSGMDFVLRGQNAYVPAMVTYGNSQEDLFPASLLSFQRIQLFGIIIIICPRDIVFLKPHQPRNAIFSEENIPYIYGQFSGGVYIDEKYVQPPRLNGKIIDLENADEVNEYYQQWILERTPMHVANLERKISVLQEKLIAMRDFERFRRGDFYSNK